MFLHRSSLREQYAWSVPLWKLYSVEAEAAGERMACFLLSQRTSALAHGGVERYPEVFVPLGKENTVCMPYVTSHFSSQ
jgi:hypothetical protein